LEELKKYENEIHKSVKQIYEFMEQQIKEIKSRQMQSEIKEESRITTAKLNELNEEVGQQRTLSVSKSFDCLRVNMVSPFDDLHEGPESKR
jgi:oligoendopeptidase F